MLRLLKSMVRIWGREVEAHPDQPLPPVIPVVLAHVSGGWTASTRFIDMFQRHLERAREGDAVLTERVVDDGAHAC